MQELIRDFYSLRAKIVDRLNYLSTGRLKERLGLHIWIIIKNYGGGVMLSSTIAPTTEQAGNGGRLPEVGQTGPLTYFPNVDEVAQVAMRQALATQPYPQMGDPANMAMQNTFTQGTTRKVSQSSQSTEDFRAETLVAQTCKSKKPLRESLIEAMKQASYGNYTDLHKIIEEDFGSSETQQIEAIKVAIQKAVQSRSSQDIVHAIICKVVKESIIGAMQEGRRKFSPINLLGARGSSVTGFEMVWSYMPYIGSRLDKLMKEAILVVHPIKDMKIAIRTIIQVVMGNELASDLLHLSSAPKYSILRGGGTILLALLSVVQEAIKSSYGIGENVILEAIKSIQDTGVRSQAIRAIRKLVQPIVPHSKGNSVSEARLNIVRAGLCLNTRNVMQKMLQIVDMEDPLFCVSLQTCQFLIEEGTFKYSTPPSAVCSQKKFELLLNETWATSFLILNQINLLYGASYMCFSEVDLIQKLRFLSYQLLTYTLKKYSLLSFDNPLSLKFLINCLQYNTFDETVLYLIHSFLCDTTQRNDLIGEMGKLINEYFAEYEKQKFLASLCQYCERKNQQIPPENLILFLSHLNIAGDVTSNCIRPTETQISQWISGDCPDTIGSLFNGLQNGQIPISDSIGKVFHSHFIEKFKQIVEERKQAKISYSMVSEVSRRLLGPWITINPSENFKALLQQFSPKDFLYLCEDLFFCQKSTLQIFVETARNIFSEDEILSNEWIKYMEVESPFEKCGYQPSRILFEIFSTRAIEDKFSSALFFKLFVHLDSNKRVSFLLNLFISCVGRTYDSAELRLLFALLRDVGDGLITLSTSEKTLFRDMVFKSEKMKGEFLYKVSSYLSALFRVILLDHNNYIRQELSSSLLSIQSVFNFIRLFEDDHTFVDTGIQCFLSIATEALKSMNEFSPLSLVESNLKVLQIIVSALKLRPTIVGNSLLVHLAPTLSTPLEDLGYEPLSLKVCHLLATQSLPAIQQERALTASQNAYQLFYGGDSYTMLTSDNETQKMDLLSRRLLFQTLEKIGEGGHRTYHTDEGKCKIETIDKLIDFNLEDAYLCLKFLMEQQIKQSPYLCRAGHQESAILHFIYYFLCKDGITEIRQYVMRAIHKFIDEDLKEEGEKQRFLYDLAEYFKKMGRLSSREIQEIVFNLTRREGSSLIPNALHWLQRIYPCDLLEMEEVKIDKQEITFLMRCCPDLQSGQGSPSASPISKRRKLSEETPSTLGFNPFFHNIIGNFTKCEPFSDSAGGQIDDEFFLNILQNSLCYGLPYDTYTKMLDLLVVPWISVNQEKKCEKMLEKFSPKDFLALCEGWITKKADSIHTIRCIIHGSPHLLSKWIVYMQNNNIFEGGSSDLFLEIISTNSMHDRFSSTLLYKMITNLGPTKISQLLHYLAISCCHRSNTSPDVRLLFAWLRDMVDGSIEYKHADLDMLKGMFVKSHKTIKKCFVQQFIFYISSLYENLVTNNSATIPAIKSILKFILFFEDDPTFVNLGAFMSVAKNALADSDQSPKEKMEVLSIVVRLHKEIGSEKISKEHRDKISTLLEIQREKIGCDFPTNLDDDTLSQNHPFYLSLQVCRLLVGVEDIFAPPSSQPATHQMGTIPEKMAELEVEEILHQVHQKFPLAPLIGLKGPNVMQKLMFLSKNLIFSTLIKRAQLSSAQMHFNSLAKVIDDFVNSNPMGAYTCLKFFIQHLKQCPLDRYSYCKSPLLAGRLEPSGRNAALFFICSFFSREKEDMFRKEAINDVCTFINEDLNGPEQRRFLHALLECVDTKDGPHVKNMREVFSKICQEGNISRSLSQDISAFLGEEQLSVEKPEEEQEKMIAELIESCHNKPPIDVKRMAQIIVNPTSFISVLPHLEISGEFVLEILRKRHESELSHDVLKKLHWFLTGCLNSVNATTIKDSVLAFILNHSNPKELLYLCADCLIAMPNIYHYIRCILSNNERLLGDWITCMRNEALFDKNGRIFSTCFFEIFSFPTIFSDLFVRLDQDERIDLSSCILVALEGEDKLVDCFNAKTLFSFYLSSAAMDGSLILPNDENRFDYSNLSRITEGVGSSYFACLMSHVCDSSLCRSACWDETISKSCEFFSFVISLITYSASYRRALVSKGINMLKVSLEAAPPTGRVFDEIPALYNVFLGTLRLLTSGLKKPWSNRVVTHKGGST